MEKYALNSKQVYEILKKKGVKNLHHANTLKTSLTFIQNNALLSRAYVESKGLGQTPQKTDAKDKEFAVWDDVFLDGTDLHSKFSKPNVYGPVMFVIPIEILQYPDFSHVFITKQNPYYWNSSQTHDDWYYSDLKQFDQDYLTGDKLKDGRICFTFKSKDARLTLKKYCERIVIDDPDKTIILAGTKVPLIKRAIGKVSAALELAGISKIPIEVRHGGSDIFCCGVEYRFMSWDKIKDKFAS